MAACAAISIAPPRSPRRAGWRGRAPPPPFCCPSAPACRQRTPGRACPCGQAQGQERRREPWAAPPPPPPPPACGCGGRSAIAAALVRAGACGCGAGSTQALVSGSMSGQRGCGTQHHPISSPGCEQHDCLNGGTRRGKVERCIGWLGPAGPCAGGPGSGLACGACVVVLEHACARTGGRRLTAAAVPGDAWASMRAGGRAHLLDLP
jgi:hypothetical protein